MYDFLVAAKTKVIPSFKTFDAGAWTSTGFLLYVGKGNLEISIIYYYFEN